MRKLYVFILVLAGLSSAKLEAQTAQDSALYRTYSELTRAYYYSHPDSNLIYSDSLIQLYRRTGLERAYADALNRKGIYYHLKSATDSALYYYKKSYSFNIQLPDSKAAAQGLINASMVYFAEARFDSALINSTRSREIFEKLGETELMARATGEMAKVYSMNGDDSTALEYFEQVHELVKNSENKLVVGSSFSDLCTVNNNLKNYETSISYCHKAIPLFKEINNFGGLSTVYQNLGNIYKDLSLPDSAIFYYDASINLLRVFEYNKGMGETFYNMSQSRKDERYNLENLALLDSALKYSKMAKDLHIQSLANKEIAEILFNEGDSEKAYEHFRMHKVLNDSIYNADNQELIGELKTKFQTEQKEKELAIKEVALSKEQLKVKQRTFILISLAGILFSGLVIGFLYVRQQNIKEENLKRENALKLQLAEAELANKIHKERERISKDLHDNVGAHINSLIAGIEVSNLHVRQDQQDKAVELLKILDEDARHAMSELRETIWLLDKDAVSLADFKDHVSSYLNAQRPFLKDLNAKIKLDKKLSTEVHLKPEQSLHLFRIVQEALTNTRKYSQATTFTVMFTYHQDQLIIDITDNGRGFKDGEIKGSGNGLKNMRARSKAMNASFELSHSTNTGVHIRITLPLESDPEIST